VSAYHRCSKCASAHMIDGAYVSAADGPRVVVGADRHPDHGPLAHPMSTRVHAAVCGSCGYVELYANQPTELYDAYTRVAGTPPSDAAAPS
jgi:hypothetical protein